MATIMAKCGKRSYRFARRMRKMNVSALREILKVSERPDVISFAGGMPAPELFPVTEIARAHAEDFADEGPESLQYSTTEGWRPLREWISNRMNRKGIDSHPDRVLMTSGSQQAIDLAARMLAEFDYDGHVSRLRREYGERCEAMLAAIESEFPAGCRSTRPEGGLFVWVELPASISGEDVFEEALADGVAFVPGASFFASEPKHNFIRLSFSHRSPDMIREGISRIGKVLKKRLR